MWVNQWTIKLHSNHRRNENKLNSWNHFTYFYGRIITRCIICVSAAPVARSIKTEKETKQKIFFFMFTKSLQTIVAININFRNSSTVDDNNDDENSSWENSTENKLDWADHLYWLPVGWLSFCTQNFTCSLNAHYWSNFSYLATRTVSIHILIIPSLKSAGVFQHFFCVVVRDEEKESSSDARHNQSTHKRVKTTTTNNRPSRQAVRPGRARGRE